MPVSGHESETGKIPFSRSAKIMQRAIPFGLMPASLTAGFFFASTRDILKRESRRVEK